MTRFKPGPDLLQGMSVNQAIVFDIVGSTLELDHLHDFARFEGRRYTIETLDLLQRRIDGWISDAEHNGDIDTDGLKDCADHIRDLLRDMGAEEVGTSRPTMRILITGSREWTDHDTIQRALVHAGQTAEKHPQQVTIVHGDARGADTIAKELGEHFGCTVEAHEVTREDWQRYGRSAGHRRNAEMVALGADICLAFPIGASPGTRGCIKLCEKAGIPVIVHEGQMP